jgi:hypothetical protein
LGYTCAFPSALRRLQLLTVENSDTRMIK